MNTSTEMDMMDADPSNATAASGADQIQASRGPFTTARQLIDQGQPAQALQAIIMAMRSRGEDEAVIQILQRALERYTNSLQSSSEAHQLASLFAECAINEAEHGRANQCPLPAQASCQNSSCVDPDVHPYGTN